MIKNVVQYIKDIKYTMSFSTIDDVIWIYIPLVVLTIAGVGIITAISTIIIKALS